jgi:predicted SnoaL-like aldol condensation-catalyzing enzyme
MDERLPAQVAAHPDPLSLVEDDVPGYAANKRLVFDMWRSVVNAGHVEMADRMLRDDYIQHSPMLPTGRAAFKQIFSAVPRLDPIPELVSPPIVALLAERDLVVMALREDLPRSDGEGTYSSVHFNLFRIEEGRLAEHWHSVQGVPGPALPRVGEGGPLPVTGSVGEARLALLQSNDRVLAANKRLVFELWQAVGQRGRAAAAGLLAEDYVEHNANGSGDAPAFRGFSDPRNPSAARVLDAPLVALVAQGDLVVLITALEHPDPRREGAIYTSTWFDMFRIENGRIAEHWDPAIVPGTKVPYAGRATTRRG